MTTILYPEADQYKNNNVNLKFFAHTHTHTNMDIWPNYSYVWYAKNCHISFFSFGNKMPIIFEFGLRIL